MKAAVRSAYGPADVLQVKEMPKPTPKANEVLVNVHATTVNRTDCGLLMAHPFIVRFFTGLFKPRSPIPGTDFAGEVVEAGKNVTEFKPGDRVFGFDDSGNLQSQAEFCTVNIKKGIFKIPEHFNYQQAAASAEAAHYAYNFINKVHLHAGDHVMINGATGAIGSAALQFCKNLGAIVTATCPTDQVELIKKLGADRVIDYCNEDFTLDQNQYEFVFDAVGKSTFGQCKKLLKPNGVYISSELGPGAQNPFLALITPIFGGKKVKFPIPIDVKGSLKFIIEQINNQQFQPVIDRSYTLADIRAAYNYVASGQKVGNVILDLEKSP